MTITDTITGDVLHYESIDEFQSKGKQGFDTSVHSVVDDLCEAYKSGKETVAYEDILGIKIA